MLTLTSIILSTFGFGASRYIATTSILPVYTVSETRLVAQTYHYIPQDNTNIVSMTQKIKLDHFTMTSFAVCAPVCTQEGITCTSAVSRAPSWLLSNVTLFKRHPKAKSESSKMQ